MGLPMGSPGVTWRRERVNGYRYLTPVSSQPADDQLRKRYRYRYSRLFNNHTDTEFCLFITWGRSRCRSGAEKRNKGGARANPFWLRHTLVTRSRYATTGDLIILKSPFLIILKDSFAPVFRSSPLLGHSAPAPTIYSRSRLRLQRTYILTVSKMSAPNAGWNKISSLNEMLKNTGYLSRFEYDWPVIALHSTDTEPGIRSFIRLMTNKFLSRQAEPEGFLEYRLQGDKKTVFQSAPPAGDGLRLYHNVQSDLPLVFRIRIQGSSGSGSGFESGSGVLQKLKC